MAEERNMCVFGGLGLVGVYFISSLCLDHADAALLVASNVLVAVFVLSMIGVQRQPPAAVPQELLHWNADIQRRGMGDLIRKVNHMAIIVKDVGRSLAFYTEIIGFQQIQRPNFDRHGAWLTMGNLELHLIKGVPNAPTGRDLIVSHLALETDYPEKVLEKLIEFEVPFRQNVSVPDPKKARDNMVECFESSEGKIMQFFVRDPDGYYLELCNCDVLTKFCLFKEEQEKTGHTPKYLQLMRAAKLYSDVAGFSGLRCAQLFKVAVRVGILVRQARRNLSQDLAMRVDAASAHVALAKEPDASILQNFLNRQKTYYDVLQGFSLSELEAALCKSGNSAPLALLLLAMNRRSAKVAMPPQYMLSEGGRIRQQVMVLRPPSIEDHPEKLGTAAMYASKPFLDALETPPPVPVDMYSLHFASSDTGTFHEHCDASGHSGPGSLDKQTTVGNGGCRGLQNEEEEETILNF